jgi:carboxypeptidase D
MLEHFPTLLISDSGLDGNTALARTSRAHFSARKRASSVAEQTHQLDLSRREPPGGSNGTIDPYYRCSLFDEAWDYAANFTAPWSES